MKKALLLLVIIFSLLAMVSCNLEFIEEFLFGGLGGTYTFDSTTKQLTNINNPSDVVSAPFIAIKNEVEDDVKGEDVTYTLKVKKATNGTLTYNSQKKEEALIVTSGEDVVVNAENAVVEHWGSSEKVDVQKVASTSYHEKGTVNLIKIATGRVIVERKTVNNILIASEDAIIAATNVSNIPTLSIAEGNIESFKVQLVDAETFIPSTPDTATVSGTSVTYTETVFIDNLQDTIVTKNDSDFADYVASVGSKKFSSLETAIDYAKGSDTVKLEKAIHLEKEIEIRKKVALDLNGYNISAGTSSIKIENGSLDISGTGTIEGEPTKNKLIYLVGSTDSTATNYSNVTVGENVTINCTNGYAIMLSAKDNKGFGVNITINGSVSGDYGALYINGSVSPTTGNVPNVTVNGTISTEKQDAVAAFAAGYGNWTFNDGCNVSGGSALYIKTGNIVINGGTFTAVRNSAVPYEYISSGYEPTGDAIVIDNCNYPGGVPNVSINGGEFSSTNAKAIGSYSYPTDQLKPITGFIHGGTFSDLQGIVYCADGATYKLKESYSGAGVSVGSSAKLNCTVDLNGKIFKCVGPAVGSKGTENQALHLEKGNTITLKNGTICADSKEIKNIIQNYSDLTLENVTLDATIVGTTNNVEYVLSNNCGDINIKGSTEIIAKDDEVALDCYHWPTGGYSEGVSVTFDSSFNGTITGKIEFAHDEDQDPSVTKHSIIIDGTSGTFTAASISVVGDLLDGDVIKSKNNSISFADPTSYSYSWSSDPVNGYYVIEEVTE